MKHISGVVAIQNYGSSGSLLLQSLFDGHTSFLGLPALYGRYLYHFWEDFHDKRATGFLDEFLRKFDHWFDPRMDEDPWGLQTMGPDADQKTFVGREAFRKELLRLGWDSPTNLSRSDFIQSVFVAYANTLGRKVNAKRQWIIFPIHSLPRSYAEYLLQDFDQVRFIHTIREPIATIGSALKSTSEYWMWNWVYLIESAIGQTLLDTLILSRGEVLHSNLRFFPDSDDGRVQSRAVRLEDLHRDSEGLTRRIADWLKVNWDETLLQSTFDGRQWNNRPSSIRTTGFGETVLKQKFGSWLNDFDRWRLRQLARHEMIYYRYATADGFASATVRLWILPALLMLPFKVEWACPHPPRAYAFRINELKRIGGITDVDITSQTRVGAMLFAFLDSLSSAFRSRKTTLKAWRKSISKECSDFVPTI